MEFGEERETGRATQYTVYISQCTLRGAIFDLWRGSVRGLCDNALMERLRHSVVDVHAVLHIR